MQIVCEADLLEPYASLFVWDWGGIEWEANKINVLIDCIWSSVCCDICFKLKNYTILMGKFEELSILKTCNLLTNQMHINLITIRWILISWDSITLQFNIRYTRFSMGISSNYYLFNWLKLIEMNEKINMEKILMMRENGKSQRALAVDIMLFRR